MGVQNRYQKKYGMASASSTQLPSKKKEEEEKRKAQQVTASPASKNSVPDVQIVRNAQLKSQQTQKARENSVKNVVESSSTYKKNSNANQNTTPMTASQLQDRVNSYIKTSNTRSSIMQRYNDPKQFNQNTLNFMQTVQKETELSNDEYRKLRRDLLSNSSANGREWTAEAIKALDNAYLLQNNLSKYASDSTKAYYANGYYKQEKNPQTSEEELKEKMQGLINEPITVTDRLTDFNASLYNRLMSFMGKHDGWENSVFDRLAENPIKTKASEKIDLEKAINADVGNYYRYLKDQDYKKMRLNADYTTQSQELNPQNVEAVEINSDLLSMWNSATKTAEFLISSKYLTEDQKRDLIYISNTQDNSKVWEYIKFMLPDLNEMTMREITDYVGDWTVEHPVLSNTVSLGTNAVSGIGFVDDTIRRMQGEELDANSLMHLPSNITNTIRGTTENQINSDLGKFLYSTGMSLADVALTRGVSGALGSAGASLGLMSTAAATNTIGDAKRRGLDDNQAYALGAISGAAEYISEKISLDTFLDDVLKGSSPTKYIVKNIVSEGSEEVLSSAINLVSDVIIAKDKSNWEISINEYMKQGLSREEAIKEALKDEAGSLMLDFLGGAISGGVMGGGAVAYDSAVNRHNNKQLGKQVISTGNAEALKNYALELDDSTDAHYLATQYKSEKPRRVATGKLYREAYTEAENQIKTNANDIISNRLSELGETDRVADVAEAIRKTVYNEELTEKDILSLGFSKNAEQVTKEFRKTLSGVGEIESEKTQKFLDLVNLTSIHFNNKITVNSTGEKTEIAGVKSVDENGEITYNLKNGETATAKEIEFDDEFTAQINKNISKYGAAGADAFQKLYNGGDAFKYERAFNSLFEHGKADPDGKLEKDALNSSLAPWLNTAQAKAAYNAGRIYAQQKTADAQAKLNNLKANSTLKTNLAQNGSQTTIKYVDTSAVDTTIFTPKQKASVATFEAISKISNGTLKFVAYESKANRKTGEIQDANGWYDPNTNTIHFDINAGIDNIYRQGELDRAILRTGGHELTHFIEKMSPRMYDGLRSFIYDTLNTNDKKTVEGLIAKKMQASGLYRDEASREVVADACEMLLKDSKTIKKLARENMTLAQKVKAWIDDFVANIKKAFEGVSAKSYEAVLMEEILGDMTELQKMWDDALEDALRTSTAIGTQEKVEVDNNNAEVYSKRTKYDEYSSLTMKWANEADRREGDTKVFCRKAGDFRLLEADGNGAVVELAKGNYKKVSAIYAEKYRGNDRSIRGNIEKFRLQQGRSDGNRSIRGGQRADDGRNSGQIRGTGLQSDHTGSNEHNRTSNKRESIKYSFRESQSGTANDKLLPYDAELSGYITRNGNYIINTFDKLKDFVNLAFDKPNVKSVGYFGIIDTQTLSKIEKSVPNIPKELNGTLFKENKDYSVAVTLDSIRHLVDEKKLMTREDVIDYLDRLADTIVDFDSVSFDYYTNPSGGRNNGLLFKKVFEDGALVSFNIISNKKRSLNLITVYLESGDYKKRKSAETLLMQNAPAHTLKAGVGQTSIDSITKTSDKVKKIQKSERLYENDFLTTENRAVENPRSSINWVYKAQLFSVTENKLFHQKISEINQGSEAFEQNADGEYMLPIENKIVFTDGDYDAPYVSKVVEVMTDSATRFEFAKEEIFNVEKGRQGLRETGEFIETVLGEGCVVKYKNNSDQAYEWTNGRRKGRNRRAVVERYQRLQDRRGDAQEGSRAESVKDVSFSQRETGLTHRELLTNALMSVAQNDVEREYLAKYQSQIEELNEKNKQVADLKRQIHDISFTKGADRSQLTALNNRVKIIEEQIQRADKKILKLEATKALKDVVAREKSAAIKKAQAQGRENLKNYKDKKRASEIREGIRKLQKDMTKSLLYPTDKNYIPPDLVKSMIDVCNAIDFGTDRTTPDGGKTKAQLKREKVKDSLNNLKTQYDKLKTLSDPTFKSEYDEAMSEELIQLVELIGDSRVKDMTYTQLEAVYNSLKTIKGILHDAKYQIGTDEKRSNAEIGMNIINEQRQIDRKKKGLKKLGQKYADGIAWNTVSPMRNILRMSGYDKNSELYHLAEELNKGQRKKDIFVMESHKMFEHLTEGKENKKKYYDAIEKTHDYGITDIEGNTVEMSEMTAMQLVMTWEREMASNGKHSHLQQSGAKIPNHKLLMDGKVSEAVSAEHAQRIEVNADVINRIVEQFDDWDMEYMETAHKFFDEKSKNALNETSRIVSHRDVALSEKYIPYKVDDDFVYKKEISDQNHIRPTLKSMGMLKDTVPNAGQPLVMTSLNHILDTQIESTGAYYGLAVPVRNFNKVWNYKIKYEASVRDSIAKNWGQKGIALVDQAIRDLQSDRVNERSKFLDTANSAFVRSVLNSNISVTLKQLSALPSAYSVLNQRFNGAVYWQFLKTCNTKYYHKIINEIDQYTAAHWQRRRGLSSQELGDIAKSMGKMKRFNDWLPAAINPTKWIQGMDCLVTASFWDMCKKDIEKQGKYQKGSEDFMEAVGELYDSVIEETQAVYDTLHRPEVLKTTNALTRQLFMFRSESLQHSGILYEKYGAMLHDKNKDNVRDFVKTAYAQYSSAMSFAILSLVGAALLHKMNPYRDEDEELTPESVIAELLNDLTNVLADLIASIGGAQLQEFIYGKISGNMYADGSLSVPAVDFINDFLSSVSTLNDVLTTEEVDKEKVFKAVEDLTFKFAGLFGIPADNAKNIIKTFILHAKDIDDGEFGSFESGVNRSNTVNYHRATEALLIEKPEKRNEKYENIWNEFKKNYSLAEYEMSYDNLSKEQKLVIKDKFEKGITAQLKEMYLDGEVDKSTVIALLTDYLGVTDINDAKLTPDYWLAKEEEPEEEETVSEPNYLERVKSKLKFLYSTGKVTREQAENVLLSYDVYKSKPNDAYWLLEQWDYETENPDSETAYSKYNEMYTAIENGVVNGDYTTIDTTVKSLVGNHGIEQKNIGQAITSKIKSEYIEVYKTDQTKAADFKVALLTAYAAAGYDRSEKSKDIDAWLKDS